MPSESAAPVTSQSLEQLLGQHLDQTVPPPASVPPQPDYIIKRNWWLPLVLFLTTCVTIFLAGVVGWVPYAIGQIPIAPFLEMPEQVAQGLQYLVWLMAILIAHEMGHFLMTVRYRIPASYPIFLPLPQLFTGTMGAVIMMDGPRATRKQLFDIGIAGPLAGLVVIIPVLMYGILEQNPNPSGAPSFINGHPLIVELLQNWLRPGETIHYNNPWLMAGWVGCLVTGINMFPMSQLDGGHVLYCLFGKKAHWIARGVLFVSLTWVIATDSYGWLLMLVIVILMGVNHPPTANDREELGLGRTILGLISLAIPVLCFIPKPM
jgi:membrane-associated protease RseP (regulator of RpoE activity)